MGYHSLDRLYLMVCRQDFLQYDNICQYNLFLQNCNAGQFSPQCCSEIKVLHQAFDWNKILCSFIFLARNLFFLFLSLSQSRSQFLTIPLFLSLSLSLSISLSLSFSLYLSVSTSFTITFSICASKIWGGYKTCPWSWQDTHRLGPTMGPPSLFWDPLKCQKEVLK